ncbi:hypothetical protein SISNIDRAFT_468065 [Sistotremastrum niveocremeum HHB9708]|uniref:Uncharacterized protein n=1 Tax=Sistotremastrum niveocremeum HHB9708 TaxID=1314777 RepID=A0A164S4D2_9AGAM|nr:hypothetical protein SISNIDRAFT_468065 [Sistotremastrum niveocremeum HHB9708]
METEGHKRSASASEVDKLGLASPSLSTRSGSASLNFPFEKAKSSAVRIEQPPSIVTHILKRPPPPVVAPANTAQRPPSNPIPHPQSPIYRVEAPGSKDARRSELARIAHGKLHSARCRYAEISEALKIHKIELEFARLTVNQDETQLNCLVQEINSLRVVLIGLGLNPDGGLTRPIPQEHVPTPYDFTDGAPPLLE